MGAKEEKRRLQRQQNFAAGPIRSIQFEMPLADVVDGEPITIMNSCLIDDSNGLRK